LFRLERRHSFQRFAELLFIQSGGMFEATRFARDCEVSRTTITNYLAVLEATFVAHVLKPFSARRATEIVAAPKVYAFDTGFVCHYRGWSETRDGDLGVLWEHFVLNELHARLQTRDIRYWRDKRRHEIDFVFQRRGRSPIAIECKWSAGAFDAFNLAAFRQIHPRGDNFVVCRDVERAYRRSVGGVDVQFVGLDALIARLQGLPAKEARSR
jgi:predicted AAA+ superfamily ATPase